MTEHWYDRAEERPNAPPDEELLEFARSPSNDVRMKADEWHIYEQRFPAIKTDKIFLAIDEYAYMARPATLKSSLAYSMVLQRDAPALRLPENGCLHHRRFDDGHHSDRRRCSMRPARCSSFTASISGLGRFRWRSTAIRRSQRRSIPSVSLILRSAREAPPIRWTSSPGLSPDGRSLRIAVVNATYEPQRFNVALANLRIREAPAGSGC